MSDANELLFGSRDGAAPLFRNQQELVHTFLSLPHSPYYAFAKDQVEYQKQQNRLKAYISQLLSGSVSRTLTEEFKRALKAAINHRLASEQQAELLTDKIAGLLTARSQSPVRHEKSSATASSVKADITAANYVSIITAKPMNFEEDAYPSEFSMRTFFLNDLINTITHKGPNRKVYRFNFPLQQYCEIFWIGLEKSLVRRLDTMVDTPGFIDSLYDQSFIDSRMYQVYMTYIESMHPVQGQLEKDLIERIDFLRQLSATLVSTLNNRRIILTFLATDPIYTLPVIAVNPSEANPQLYFFLEDENRKQSFFKASSETLLLWRMFVWDKLKATGRSKEINYKSLIL